MTTASLYRLSGVTMLVGATLTAVSQIVGGALFPDNGDPATATNSLNVLLDLIGVAGAILVLLGLPGVFVRAAHRGGLVWLAGVVLIAIMSMLFGIFSGLMGALVFPVLASRAPGLFQAGPPPSIFALFIVGTLAGVVGAILMGIPMITKQIYPRWCGYLLILGAVLTVADFAVSGPGSGSGSGSGLNSIISQIVSVVSSLPLFVVLGWAGYELWSGTPEARGVAAGAAVAQTAGA